MFDALNLEGLWDALTKWIDYITTRLGWFLKWKKMFDNVLADEESEKPADDVEEE
jgi:hypothetical protein